MSQRDALLAATERLIWEVGYEAMSPKSIQRESGAGQGSMYHHFTGKQDLAIQAMERHGQVLERRSRELLGDPLERGPLDAIGAWLTMSRDGLAGCRLGRLANERSVRTDDALRAPLQHYFLTLHQLLRDALRRAQRVGELPRTPAATHLASVLIAVVQGGYALALATQDSAHLDNATSAAWRLLQAHGRREAQRRSEA